MEQHKASQIATLLESGRASLADHGSRSYTASENHVQILHLIGRTQDEEVFDEIEEIIADYMNGTSLLTAGEAAAWIVESRGEQQ